MTTSALLRCAMQYETAVRCRSRYSRNMQTEYMLAGVWMLCIGVLGFATVIIPFVGWTAVLALALTPPVIMMRFWGAPARTMSETIRTCFADLTAGSIVENDAGQGSQREITAGLHSCCKFSALSSQ